MDDKRYTLMNKNRPVLDFLDSEVADMKDASAKLLCDSNSGQPSKNLHTEH